MPETLSESSPRVRWGRAGGGGLAKSYRGLSVQAKDKYGQISEHPQLDKGLWVQCN